MECPIHRHLMLTLGLSLALTAGLSSPAQAGLGCADLCTSFGAGFPSCFDMAAGCNPLPGGSCGRCVNDNWCRYDGMMGTCNVATGACENIVCPSDAGVHDSGSVGVDAGGADVGTSTPTDAGTSTTSDAGGGSDAGSIADAAAGTDGSTPGADVGPTPDSGLHADAKDPTQGSGSGSGLPPKDKGEYDEGCGCSALQAQSSALDGLALMLVLAGMLRRIRRR